LGKIFEKAKSDKRFKEILKFQYDLKNGFTNYHGEGLLSHYHEAAYDAYMTGYCFGKILKAKEVDDFYHKKKLNKGRNKKEDDKGLDLKKIENNPVNFGFQFS